MSINWPIVQSKRKFIEIKIYTFTISNIRLLGKMCKIINYGHKEGCWISSSRWTFSTIIISNLLICNLLSRLFSLALIIPFHFFLLSFFPRSWCSKGHASKRSEVDKLCVVCQQMGKVSMAVRSAAMSHIELPTTILGRCDHVLLLYRVHTFREVVPENLLFLHPSPIRVSCVVRQSKLFHVTSWKPIFIGLNTISISL